MPRTVVAGLLFVAAVGALAATGTLSADAGPAGDPVQARAVALSKEDRYQAPPGWRWGTFVDEDGARLRYGHDEAGHATRGTIVLLPGFRSPAEDFLEAARDFEKMGYRVFILDWRGQGGSERWLKGSEKSVSMGFAHDESDLKTFVALVSRTAQAPVFLVGESYGAHIGLRLLHDSPQGIAAAAFSSPSIAFRTGDYPVWFVRTMSAVASFSGYGTSYGSGQGDWKFDPDLGKADDPVSDDRDRQLAAEGNLLTHPAERQGGATWGYIHQFYRSSDMMQAPGWMAAIKAPVLFGVVAGDAIADDSVMLSSCRAMQHCSPIIFHGTKHALFGDRDAVRTAFLRAVDAFLLAHGANEEARR